MTLGIQQDTNNSPKGDNFAIPFSNVISYIEYFLLAERNILLLRNGV